MKKTALFLLVLTSHLYLFAQTNEIVKINTLDPNIQLAKSQYLHPTFMAGKVIFKDGATAETKLNFNRFTNQMLFINANGDTLTIARPETTSKVIQASDTFYFHQNTFLLKLTSYDNGPNLFVKQSMKYIGKEKKGVYGTYSNISSSSSMGNYTDNGQITSYILADENLFYKATNEFYLTDTFNNFLPAKKSSLLNLFPLLESDINAFIKTNKLGFTKKADLLQIIFYCQKLK